MAGELFRDLGRRLPGYQPQIVFDVGANVGQSTREFRAAWPEALIHAFEPVAETYRTFQGTWEADPLVLCHHLALGRVSEEVTITARGTSTENQVLRSTPKPHTVVEQTRCERGDAFCAKLDVHHIGLLKIDTEGFDLDVLVGFQSMLAEERVDLIQVEAAMNTTNRKHVPFTTFCSYLNVLGYELLRIYDQGRERDGRPLLRLANPLFISRSMVRRFTTKRA